MIKLYYLDCGETVRVWSDKDVPTGTFEVMTPEDFKVLQKYPNLFILVQED